MEKRLMVIFAHPDDESFGPSGTLAHYVQTGARVQLITATKGEAGKNALGTDEPVGQIRERELQEAVKVLGLEKLHFLGYIDKTLKDLEPQRPIEKILHIVNDFKPQVLISYGPTGISMHSDHITVHKWASRVFRMSAHPQKLYYHTVPRELLLARHPDLTFDDGEITTIIDVRKYHDIKKSAVLCHQTQRYSIERIFDFAGGSRSIPEEETFVLADHKLKDYQLQGIENELFAGINVFNREGVG